MPSIVLVDHPPKLIFQRWLSFLQGKVRDTYDLGDKIVIVTTDRQSAFDRVLAVIPFKVSSQSSLSPSGHCLLPLFTLPGQE